MRLPDALGFDVLADELACDPDRVHSRPSDFHTVAAFTAATAPTDRGAQCPIRVGTQTGNSAPPLNPPLLPGAGPSEDVQSRPPGTASGS